MMDEMSPKIVIMGEAPSANLDYAAYDNYNKITQNSAGDTCCRQTRSSRKTWCGPPDRD